jgi:uncharacterized protein (TIGR00369 family)
MTDRADLAVPEGFVQSTRGPYTSHNGPIFHKVTDDGMVHAFRVLDRHCNGHGILHGGMMMTFADGVLASAVHRAVQVPALTLRMTCDFVAIGRLGDWVEGVGTVMRATRSVAFVEGRLRVGERTILTTSAVFKLMRDRKRPAKG